MATLRIDRPCVLVDLEGVARLIGVRRETVTAYRARGYLPVPLGRIAAGISNDLVSRAADVILKERRKLICVIRDTPYNLVHIRNMETVTLAGGIICPASPSFYSRPSTIEEVAATVVDRVLDLAGIEIKTFRWGQ